MKRFYFALLLVIGAVFLDGCVAPVPAKRLATFDESEFAPYAGTGTSTVTGQAFLKTKGGDVRFGAGCQVFLIPVTSYTTETYERLTIGGEKLEAPDPRTKTFKHITIADGNGNFEFHGVPAGSYYLVCDIVWEIATEYGMQKTGGTAYGKVTVAAGETTKAILTR